jgi:gliding motility-associated-like protein
MRKSFSRYCILLLAGLLTYFAVNAQNISNRGKEFWLGYGLNYHFYPNNDNVINDQELALYISTEQAAVVTVSVNGTTWTQTLNIPANTVDATIVVPKSGTADARLLTDGLSTRAVHIVSDVPVAVFAHQYSNQNSGATMLMPAESYGYAYHSINYYQTTADMNNPNWYCYFYAVASENNTRLEITPSDTTQNGWLPGQTYTVNLNQGQIFTVYGKATFNNIPSFGSKDMTGTKIISVPGGDGSCHPFALFSGSGGIRLCRGDGAEVMHQQVFPVQSWGTRYLTYHTINNGNSDLLPTNRNYYRICVSDPATVVRKNGLVMTGLIKNFFYEYMDSTGGDFIEADKPVLVSQYTPNKNQCWNFPPGSPSPPSDGDPEMMYLSPLEQGQKYVNLWASRQSSAITYVYYQLIVPTAGLSSLKTDGNSIPASQIIPHPNHPSYSVALARHIGSAAHHIVTCDSAFTGIIYGIGNYESYGYNIGANINNLNNYSGIKNTLNTTGNTDTFTCPKTPVRLFVKLGFQATSITWKLSQVTGISPNTDSVINNPVVAGTEIINGRTYYLYTLQQDFTFNNTGTYYVPVTYATAVTQNCTRAGDMTVKVVVKPGPVSNFTVTGAGCLKDTVSFTSAATTNGFNITAYLWNFDDGSTQNTVNAQKRFLTSGNQTIRYRIYADNGCAGDTSKAISILPEPVSKIGVTPVSCDSVLISDTSTISSGSITSWRYYFGDGTNTTSNSGNPFYHVYQLPGTYIVKHVTVSNNNCVSDTAYSVPVVILDKPNAKFGFDKNICVGDSILFSDSTTLLNGSITSWKWNFGDGNTLTKTNNSPFFYKYAAVGVYTVLLQTTGSNGCSDTFSLRVSVNNKPVATFSVAGKRCVDSSMVFTSSLLYNAGNPASWYWDFGDAQSATVLNSNSTTHSYSNALSNVTVKHSAGYGPGCMSDTATYLIALINPNPAAVPFTVSDLSACALKPVQFTATATGIAQWLWNFGDGTGTQVPPFSRSYTNASNYNVTLQVVSAAGCGSAVSTQNIVVLPAPVVNAGADKLISTGASIGMTAAISPAGNYSYLWTPAAGLSNATLLNPVATPQATTTYAVTATDNINGCTSTDSVKITVISKLFIPNAFTPNNDGRNDKWAIPAMALYPDATVAVFNRYGEKIFESDNYVSNPWDGTFKGKAQPMGSYVYIIRFSADKSEKGIVTIVR